MLKAKVIETLPCGCVTWTSKRNTSTSFERLTKSSCESLAFSADVVPATPPSPSLKMTRCESIETTIRKRRLYAGAVARQSKEQLPSRVMFGMLVSGENPRPGRQFKTWHRRIVEDLREFRGTKINVTLPLGVWSWDRAVGHCNNKWYPGVLEAAERFMVKWHEDEAQLSRQRRASAVGGAQGNGGRGATGVEGKPRWTKLGRRRQIG